VKSFNKYTLYENAVQDAGDEIRFINTRFKKIYGTKPLVLREDFGGTGYVACEWVKQSGHHQAFAIDLDSEPIQYGKQTHYQTLNGSQKKRMRYLKRDVLHAHSIKADAVCALNFSTWFFKERKTLLAYLSDVRRSLRKKGVFVMDTTGGHEVVLPHMDRKRFKGYTYFWQCKSYNPVNRNAHFAIHFKPHGQRLRKNVFTYDWRYWTVPELRDIMAEAGFSKSIVYWEGDDGEGGGNAIFRPVEKADDSEVWLAYIIAIP
jgi:hypothetical protein